MPRVAVAELPALRGGRVIVVDNASGDDSVAHIATAINDRGWGGWAELIALPRNGGFAYGNIRAIERVRAHDPSYGAAEGRDTSAFSSVGSDSTFFRLERLTVRILRMQSERLRLESACLDDKLPGKLLDVGCGNGSFAAAMRQRGWTVRGTDFDPSAADNARKTHGLDVDIGDLRDIRYDDGPFDAITVRDVVEHVRDPEMFVTECWRMLNPGGHLVFITPNAGSLGHAHFGSRWRGREQPRQLFLFDCTSMTALLHRAGIQVADVFSSAQGGMYVRRESCETSRSFIRRWVDCLATWWVQFRETCLIRRGQHVGEELVAIAAKPSSASRSN